MKLESFVYKVDNAFDAILGQRIMQYIDKKAVLASMGITSGVNKNVRNVEGMHLYIEKQKMLESILFMHIAQEVYKFVLEYKKKFDVEFSNTFGIRSVNQIDLLKYNQGGKYEVHVDSCVREDAKIDRELTCIFNLNSGYKGGEFCFYNAFNKKDQFLKLNLKANSVVIFPSNVLFPHTVQPITEGTRYSIVSWL